MQTWLKLHVVGAVEIQNAKRDHVLKDVQRIVIACTWYRN